MFKFKANHHQKQGEIGLIRKIKAFLNEYFNFEIEEETVCTRANQLLYEIL